MARERIEEVREIVRRQVGAPRVQAGDRLLEDLGLESTDVVSIVAAIEDLFGVTIDERELPRIHTVEDLCRLAGDRAGS